MHNGLGILSTYGYVVAPLAVRATELAAGDLAAGYDGTLAATGGVEPYTWSIADGHLPAGVELAPDGALTGVPALPGERTFAAQVRDAVGATAAGTFTVTVGGCDRTVTGTHRGSLTADTGVLCLDQADQYGDVVLTGDARLAVLGATLRGAVRASGSAAVTLCGTDVRGELNVAGTDGRILVDPSDCATSMVAGGQAPR